MNLPEIAPELVAANRSNAVVVLLRWLCDLIEEETGVASIPAWSTAEETGDVVFSFEGHGIRYHANPASTVRRAKEMWEDFRESFPHVFFGEAYARFLEEWRASLSVEDLSKLDDQDFARLFQEKMGG